MSTIDAKRKRPCTVMGRESKGGFMVPPLPLLQLTVTDQFCPVAGGIPAGIVSVPLPANVSAVYGTSDWFNPSG